MLPLRWILLLLIAPVTELQRLHAQGTCRGDVVHGRVVAPDGKPVEAASVYVTELSSRTTQSRLTDASAAFSICFEQRASTYVVMVSAPPNPTWRKRVVAEQGGTSELLVTLAPPPPLPTVTVVAPRRNRVRRGEEMPDLTTEGMGAGGQLTPDQEESIASYAGTLPGVLVTGQRGAQEFSVLGLSPDNNRTTLNGLTYIGMFPRNAGPVGTVGMSLRTSADAASGGFSGAALALTNRSGLNMTRRSLRATLDGLGSSGDRVAWSAGRTASTVRATASLEGGLPGRMIHATSMDFTTRTGSRSSLLNIDALPASSTGISPADVHRFVAAADSMGLPLRIGDHSDRQSSVRAAFMTRVDINPSSPAPIDVTLSTSAARTNALGVSALRLPTQAWSATQTDLTVQVARTNWWGPVRHSPRIGASVAWSASELDWPAPRVLVRTNPDSAGSDLVTLGAGGGGLLAPSAQLTGIQFRDQMSWYSMASRHRFDVTTEAERLGFTAGAPVDYGTYSYASLDDFAAQRAASYSRRLSSPSREIVQTATAVSASDVWRLSQRLQVQLGARLDATQLGFAQIEPVTWQVQDEHRTDVSFSPRAGALVTYGRSSQPALSSGSIRLGVGRYVNRWSPDRLARAAPARQREAFFTCLDDAVPAAAWAAWIAGTQAPAQQCAPAGARTFAGSDISRLGDELRMERSWRGNLEWSTTISRWSLMLQGIVARVSDAQSSLDVNLVDAPRFQLAGEGGRPVFVSPSDISSASGASTLISSRRDTTMRHVWSLTSLDRSFSRQLLAAISPRTTASNRWSVTYVLGDARADFVGWGAPTAGDPRLVRRAPSMFDIRHRFVLTGSRQVANAITVSAYVNARSGLPYTPMVAGDVNGDGAWNDAAYVPSRADSSFVAGIPERAFTDRRCLRSHVGVVAPVNSCRGPWLTTVDLRASTLIAALGLPRNLFLSASLLNVAAAADVMLHGRNVRGWGQAAMPDPNLLVVSGFDVTRNTYTYAVNPGFGIAPRAFDGRSPFRFVVEGHVELGPDPSEQYVAPFLKRGRGAPGDPLTLEQTHAQLVSASPDPIKGLVAIQDSIMLSDEQLQKLNAIRGKQLTATDRIWLDLARFLAAQPKSYDAHEAGQRMRRAQYEVYGEVQSAARAARDVLGADQLRMLSGSTRLFLDPNAIEQLRRYFKG